LLLGIAIYVWFWKRSVESVKWVDREQTFTCSVFISHGET